MDIDKLNEFIDYEFLLYNNDDIECKNCKTSLKTNKIRKKIAAIDAKPNTMIAPIIVSFFVGQVTLNASCFTP